MGHFSPPHASGARSTAALIADGTADALAALAEEDIMSGENGTRAQVTKGGRRPRLLLAEDDAAMRNLLALTLGRAGFELTVAASGDEAIDRVADLFLADGAAGFDLIIADVRMPGCTGLDLLACLRHFACRTPVILITAFGNGGTHEQARRLGAFAVLDKPFDLRDLESAAALATPTAR